ncbi:ABC-type cobalamin/Fe3+-siderophores transport system ATPase subunit [Flavobacterium sp. SORGH_AS 622]|nr:ABC-type cobalamin/Fe3+-siderophores transport system ATPase subunit [Flavobacterium sp. SORGH_AS_0622]
MIDEEFNIFVTMSNDETLTVPLKVGESLFILGANGMGKSGLMTKISSLNPGRCTRILGHRQNWIQNSAVSITSADRKTYNDYISHFDTLSDSRFKNDYSSQRVDISIFDLILKENSRAREITKALDAENSDKAKELSHIQSPINALNEIFAISNIPIRFFFGDDDSLMASKNNGAPYNVWMLSDGERNALLIGANILTSKPNSLILIDEPERHLHRSIISPMITALIAKRNDCAFVVSTHDINLPTDNSSASTLLVRGCEFDGDDIKSWDIDLLFPNDSVTDDIKHQILGAKREILFVEGDATSLDIQIYPLLYPKVSVIPRGSCSQVERAIDGINGVAELSWVNAFAIIDADDRTDEQIEKLYEKGIVALPAYSVEALYYNLDIIKRVAKKISTVTGENENEIFEASISTVVADISLHRERMCARLCEKRVRNAIMIGLPSHQTILNVPTLTVTHDLAQTLNGEIAVFDGLVSSNDINGLISRYPIRETPVLKKYNQKIRNEYW